MLSPRRHIQAVLSANAVTRYGAWRADIAETRWRAPRAKTRLPFSLSHGGYPKQQSHCMRIQIGILSGTRNREQFSDRAVRAAREEK